MKPRAASTVKTGAAVAMKRELLTRNSARASAAGMSSGLSGLSVTPLFYVPAAPAATCVKCHEFGMTLITLYFRPHSML